ncbi:unnamed protein product [Acanthocheilonema viteae]|uniref:Uncharacterized protein n=1 Tax=Acanthocheilonema viteae TaxID=6277 RepID=A0A498SHG5_ACAVI|nr:unnamed protein product [Acanthocheilonema viteae]
MLTKECGMEVINIANMFDVVDRYGHSLSIAKGNRSYIVLKSHNLIDCSDVLHGLYHGSVNMHPSMQWYWSFMSKWGTMSGWTVLHLGKMPLLQWASSNERQMYCRLLLPER